ncbi:Ankyrin repeat family protein, putative isoform 2 [Hibiscus syriacus]|uniref:Ankyrin repeat family protein, putative isoform 2 n=1 Tax=Hibiscus syriacus TaxID=106335 RepID=A0A6A3C192_HIBSY|nr:Ankyrin repeat family protein, putative isoform 2 [Hibiscus syriacus]
MTTAANAAGEATGEAHAPAGRPPNYLTASSSAMENLVKLSEGEVRTNFILNTKCRCNLVLRSLSPSFPVAFKVQTSSPHKFLVNPPSGVVPPLSHLTLRIILKPQDQIPPTFPRSLSDRFLIRAAPFHLDSAQPHSHAVTCGDFEAVKNIIKRHKSALYDLSPKEAESLLRVVTQLDNNPEDMVNLLLEAGLRVGGQEHPNVGLYQTDPRWESKGWNEVHVAVAFDRTADFEVLLRKGKHKNARSNDGRTALYRAVANGNCRMVEMLIEMDADPTFSDDRGRSPPDIARDKDHEEMVEVMERGKEVFTAARIGDKRRLQALLNSGASINFQDQYGLTPLHVAV